MIFFDSGKKKKKKKTGRERETKRIRVIGHIGHGKIVQLRAEEGNSMTNKRNKKKNTRRRTRWGTGGRESRLIRDDIYT